MKHVDLLLPFALPHNEMAPDLLREIKAPSLAMIAARAKAVPRRNFDDFSRILPHERWLAEQFGLACGEDDNLPAAVAAMQFHGIDADAGAWFIVQPVHLHIARDHLVLTDPRHLNLDDEESRALFAVAQPLFAEAGMDLRYGDAAMWFVRRDDWQDMQTATPDAATGHNIDIWMPRGAQARAWRKVQNEVQMEWHLHAANAARESRGAKPVNSLWLWGGATAPAALPPPRHAAAFNLTGWSEALAHRCAHRAGDRRAQDVIDGPGATLVVCDELLEPAFAQDWSEWLARMQALESAWLAPLREALKAGKINRLRVILTHATGLMELPIDRLALHKFWTQPSLARLAP
jgi:hypothetical protein